MAQNFWYPPGSSSSNSITANQGTPTVVASAWPMKITDGVDVALVSAGGELSVSAASLPLPSGAATAANQTSEIALITAANNKMASSDVSEDFDYRAFAYVGATNKIDTITYKTGGSGGTTVATQTFGYDGSDRITSITKT